ncbi:mechanosensitive ion channel family protein [Marinobacter sp. F4216]|uniref:mechanosensitive ion channel family protein n=1 Tax=Marinobacter sp. F4216 TaxID=2874281 RepID=UPI001CBB62F6|nr:mechanosensitive ion channel domain-containing protein [Marinobacter sp. F4216]MBZ2169283.1 mechanosensitive ion channel [Marinobacter sp. F4216]
MDDLFGADGRASEWMDQAVRMVMAYAPKVLLAIVTLIIGLWIINRFVAILDTKLSNKDPSLNKFLCGLVSAILKVLLLISVASMVGIATTSFVAIVGAAGLAVGLALQGSLANFAGGVLILIFKPFKVGDVIDAQGYVGTVREISILYTIMDTFDNRRVIVPNGQLANSSLTNNSAYETRRCDLTFGIGYGDDIDAAKAIIQRLIDQDERALKEPEPVIVVGGLGESSVDLTVRVWTKSADLWPFYWSMQESVKKTFDAEGIRIPFPQRDVHLFKTE